MPEEPDLLHPATISGYDFGSTSTRSPLSLEDLQRLEAAAGLTEQDDVWLARAGELLAPYAGEMVDAWRALLGEHEHLAAYSRHPDGSPAPEYAAASHPRFARWVIDLCTRPRDRSWLDYQHEIGRRHTPAAKNRTDDAAAPDHVPLRYLLAFCGPVIVTTRDFLVRSGAAPEEVEAMHAAFTKALMLDVTLWTRAYTEELW